MEAIEGLKVFLNHYPTPIARLANDLVGFLAENFLELSCKILPGWQAVSFRHPRAGYVCGVLRVRIR